MLLHVSAMNCGNLGGATVLEDTCSMLCNLLAVNGELYIHVVCSVLIHCGMITLVYDSSFMADKLRNMHLSSSTVSPWRWSWFVAETCRSMGVSWLIILGGGESTMVISRY